MCGRYGYSDPDLIYDRFEVETFLNSIEPHYNAAPSQTLPIVVRHSPNQLQLTYWGIHPKWSSKLIINAKAENLSTSKMWLEPFRFNRAIVPAQFYFEWDKKSGTPYCFKLKNDEMFGIPALILKDEENKRDIFVIITTAPNEVVGAVHPRMGAILLKENEDKWLNPDETEPEELMKLLDPYPAELMESFAVSKLVGNPSNDTPEIIKPV